MSKPNDIANDVWADAGRFAMKASEVALRNLEQEDFSLEFNAIRTQVARAILSERTKAAEIAATFPWSRAIENFDDARDLISSAIRKGGKE